MLSSILTRWVTIVMITYNIKDNIVWHPDHILMKFCQRTFFISNYYQAMQGILFPADNIYKAFPNLSVLLYEYYSSHDSNNTNANILSGTQSAAACTGTLSNG